MKYIVALDEGTTSVRAVLYNTQTHSIEKIEKQRLKQIFPASGLVEHDANVIWNKQTNALKKLTADIDPQDIHGICITNQRETVVAWDKRTGKPICNAIVWQCRRTADMCKKLNKDKALCKKIKQKTGLLPDAYFSGTKIKWILDNVKAAKKLLKETDMRTEEVMLNSGYTNMVTFIRAFKRETNETPNVYRKNNM
jgi:glycerol kinase